MKKLILLSVVFTLLSCATTSREPAGAQSVLDSSGYLYDPTDKSCDGYPRLKVDTMPGTCLGLVMGKDQLKANGAPLIMPRTIVQLKDSDDFLITDMGGWHPNKGAVYWMRRAATGFQLIALKTGLNMPHGLSYGPDGMIYIGQSQEVDRFKFEGGHLSNWQVVIAKMPRTNTDMHPLTQFTFDKHGNLFVNQGAATDHCSTKDDGGYADCPDSDEVGYAGIYMYSAAQVAQGNITIGTEVAKGLRNSMAMVVSDNDELIQGDNGRDFPELEEPYEEINVITPAHHGWHYGWPVCYDFHATSPEWLYKNNDPRNLKALYNPVDCNMPVKPSTFNQNQYAAPHALMPPHAAPLQMAFYNGDSMKDLLGGKLLVGWHGYQPTGHRLVAYNVDNFGRPLLKNPDGDAFFYMDQKGGCPVKHPFSPRGGLDRYSPYTEVISGWDQQKGLRPRGTPTGFIVARDGSVIIVEDKNIDIVRLARTNAAPLPTQCSNTNQTVIDPRIEMLAWRQAVLKNPVLTEGYQQIQSQVIQTYCAQCHGGFASTDIAADRFQTLDFFVKNDWLVAGQPKQSKIIDALANTGVVPAMPPAGEKAIADRAGAVNLVSSWISKLPTDVDKHVAKIKVGGQRLVRSQPNDNAIQCGIIPMGDDVYVDPNDRQVVNGVQWTKVFLLPKDSRLLANRCPVPEDGVYWMHLLNK